MERSSLDTIGLLSALARTVNAAPDYPSAIRGALGTICEATGWPFGEAWTLHESDNVLACEATWCADEGLESFRRTASTVTLEIGTGLPGRVWSSGEPLWHPDVSVLPEEEFVRCHDARQAGLHAGLGVPVLVNDEPAAVLTFFLTEARPADWDLANTVGLAAAHLGMLLVRGRLEERLKAAEARLERTASRVASLREWITANGEQDMLAVLSHVSEGIHQALGADQTAVVVYGAGNGDEERVVECGDGSLFTPAEMMEVLEVRGHLSREGEPLATEGGLMLAVPIMSDEEMLGGLFVARSPGQSAFSAFEVAQAREFTDEIAAGLIQTMTRQRIATLGVLESRLRLLGELQDDVVQHLFALGLEFDALAHEHAVSGKASATIREGIQRVNDLIVETRDYVQILTGDEGEAAGHTRDLCRELASLVQRHVPVGITVNLHITSTELEIDGSQVAELLLIAREALDNAVEHSKSPQIAVAVQDDAGKTRLVIQDHGVGFNQRSPRHGPGFQAMHAAARRLGTELTIQSIPRMGTTVVVEVPRVGSRVRSSSG